MNVIKWFEDVVFDDGLNIKTMNVSSNYKEVRIIIPQNKTLKEHKAPAPIMVQVLRGKILFEANGKKHELRVGDMVSLEALAPHSLSGVCDSIVRLSLSIVDDVERVGAMAK